MEVEKELMKTLAEDFNTQYLTISEVARKWGYFSHTALLKKVRKLKLGYRIKTVHLLSEEDQEILRRSIQRRTED